MRSSLRLVASALLILTLSLPVFANPDFPPAKFSAVRSPVSAGGEGLVSVQTRPNTYCVIAVVYKSGPSKAKGLGPRVADAQGSITWTWKIGTRTTPGTWPIVVECGKGEVIRIRTTFEVI